MEIQGIKYIAPVFDMSGYAQAARAYVIALHKLGIPLTITPVSFEDGMADFGEDGKIISNLVNKNINYNIVIIHLTVEHYEKMIEKDKFNIGYSIWETNRIHDEWVNWLNSTVDVCFTGSKWGTEVYKNSGVKIPIFTIPHTINVEDYDNITPYLIAGVPENAYKFYALFQFFERKHPTALIKAYWHAFQNNENVALVLKTYRIGFNEKEKTIVKETISRLKQVTPMDNYPPIYLVLDRLSRAEILGMHKACDCLVHLDRGEGFGLCVAADTNILTNNGSKRADDLKINDLVMAKDGCFHKVLGATNRYVKNALKIKPKLCEPILVSCEHPFLVGKFASMRFSRIRNLDNIESKLNWLEADFIDEGDMIAIPKPKLDNLLPSKIDIADYVNNENIVVDGNLLYNKNGYFIDRKHSYKNLVKNYGFTKKIFEGAVRHLKNGTEPTINSDTYEVLNLLKSLDYKPAFNKTINRFIEIDENLLYLFGWYLAEGSSTNNKVLELDMHKNEFDVAIELKNLFIKYFGVDENSINVWVENNTTRLTVSNSTMAEFFGNFFGKGADNKKIPKILFECGKHLKSLILGLYAGDGHDSGRYYELSTVSQSLAYQARFVLMSFGVLPVFEKTINGTGNDMYNIKISGANYYKFFNKKCDLRTANNYIETTNYFLVRVAKKNEVKYNAYMYDFTIEDAESFVGNGVLLHNCPFEAGAIGNPIIVTGWGGVTEYANPDNSYLVNSQLTPVFGMPWSPFYNGNQLWAEPDVYHGSQLMRHVYRHRNEAVEKGNKLRKTIKNNFSYEVIGNKIIEVIKSL